MSSKRISVEEYDVERRKCEDAGKNVDESFIIIKRRGSQDIIYQIEEEEDEEDILVQRLKIESGNVRKIRESARIEKIGEDVRIERGNVERRQESSKLILYCAEKEEISTEKEKRERIKFKSSKEYQGSDDEIMSYIKIYIGRRPGNFDIDRIEDKKILKLIRNATRYGYESDKEIFDFIKYRRLLNKSPVEFAPAVKGIVPKLEDEFDRRYDAGEELVVEIPVETFLLEMGHGETTFIDLGRSRILKSIKRILQYEGMNVRYTEKQIGDDIIQYFMFWALTDEEARKIEEQYNRNRRQETCRKMVKKVCKNKIHNEDKDSLWKDVEFIKNISGCSFDVRKVEERVKKGKEDLFNDRIIDGIGLLFK